MDDLISTLPQWASAIGALAGAVIGFSGAFLLAVYNKRRDEVAEIGRLRREHVERLFMTLNKLRDAAVSNTTAYGRSLLDPDFKQPFIADIDKQRECKLECLMIISLYLPEFEEGYFKIDKTFMAYIKRCSSVSFDVFGNSHAIIPSEDRMRYFLKEVEPAYIDFNKAMNDLLSEIAGRRFKT